MKRVSDIETITAYGFYDVDLADAEFMEYTRLFRCSNEKGYFTVAEKCKLHNVECD